MSYAAAYHHSSQYKYIAHCTGRSMQIDYYYNLYIGLDKLIVVNSLKVIPFVVNSPELWWSRHNCGPWTRRLAPLTDQR